MYMTLNAICINLVKTVKRATFQKLTICLGFFFFDVCVNVKDRSGFFSCLHLFSLGYVNIVSVFSLNTEQVRLISFVKVFDN